MKYLPMLAIAILVAGCGSSEPAPDRSSKGDAAPENDPKAEIRAKLKAKRQDLAQADSELAAITADRDKVMKQEASDAKTTRLIEIQRQENDTKQKKAVITDDIAQLEAELTGQAAARKPAKAGDAL